MQDNMPSQNMALMTECLRRGIALRNDREVGDLYRHKIIPSYIRRIRALRVAGPAANDPHGPTSPASAAVAV